MASIIVIQTNGTQKVVAISGNMTLSTAGVVVVTGGAANTLVTPRAIYGNNFDGSAALTQIIASTFGGTGNGFAKFSGPAGAEKTFTLPNADATILYSGGPAGTPSSGNLANCTGYPSLGYTVPVATSSFSPADGAVQYLGFQTQGAPSTSESLDKVYIPKTGTIKAIYLNWRAITVAGSNESITMELRLNATTSTTIASVGDTNAVKQFSNNALAIAVTQGDYVQIKLTCPTWATNPTGVVISGVVYIE